MSGSWEREERCETCRFWVPESAECHRHAPSIVVLPLTPGTAAAAPKLAGAWPVTGADQWCGEWAIPANQTGAPAVSGESVATRVFLARVAPGLDPHNPALLGSLLEQLPADVRRVLVRTNGLDGRPPAGLRDVAREFKMSQGHVRALLATGEQLLAEVVRLLTRPREKA
jgi:hypothetical protein